MQNLEKEVWRTIDEFPDYELNFHEKNKQIKKIIRVIINPD